MSEKTRPPTEEQNRPVLDKDVETNEWVIKVACAAWVRIPIDQRDLANDIWSAATWAYNNGRRDVQRDIKRALGVS